MADSPFKTSQKAFHDAMSIMHTAFGYSKNPDVRKYEAMRPEDFHQMTQEQGLTGTIDYIRRIESQRMKEQRHGTR